MLKKIAKSLKLRVMLVVMLICSIFATSTYAASSLYDEFNSFNTSLWEKADGYSNGSMFNCTWRANNVTFSNGTMHLKLTSPSYNKFDGAEYRSKQYYGYGKYEVRMKPAKNVGIVSSFFTYTGPGDGTPWDEIDIEFLGKDTTKVQFNYYTNGVGNHEALINLGFDASQSYHTYAFDWQPGSIKWYVDGVLKHTATSNIPSHPGKIMMNLWNGTGVDSWLGAYNGVTPLTASYEWVKYTPSTSSSTAGDFKLNAWEHSSSSGITKWTGGVGSFDAGDWIKFSNVNLSSGYNAFAVSYATTVSGSLEIRMDSPTGTLLGTVNYPSTNSWSTYKWNGTNLNPAVAKGTHDIYIVGKSGYTNLQEFWFKNE
jgi:beta-glucanase (GH16 family)